MNSTTLRYAGMYILGAVLGGLLGAKVGDLLLPEENHDLEIVEEIIEDYAPEKKEADTVEELGDEPIPDDAIIVEGTIIRPGDVFDIERDASGKPKVKKKKKGEPEMVDYTGYHIPNPHVKKARLSDLAKKYIDEEPSTDANTEIISRDEYDESRREKLTLTYYEGDDTLCDRAEVIIPNQEDIVGPDALVKFGTRSDDPDAVYVRNHKTGTDYEVLRDRRKYSVLVCGMPDEEPLETKKKRKGKLQDEQE